MEFSVKTGQAEKQRTACLVIPVYEDRVLPPNSKHLNRISQGFLLKQLRRADHNGKLGQQLMLYDVPNIRAERVLLVGVGQLKSVSEHTLANVTKQCILAINKSGAKDALYYLDDDPQAKRPITWRIGAIARIAAHSLYRFTDFMSQTDESSANKLDQINFLLDDKSLVDETKEILHQASCIAAGTELSKNLGNTPANVCTPTYLAEHAKKLAKTFPSIKTKILDKAEIVKLKMGSFLAVAQGSIEPPKLITLEYHGHTKKMAPIVLVGKGVTFDAGGLSIKPANAMMDMKYDMLGAATVLGVIKAIALLELPLHVVGVIPATENLPSGSAIKPGDIVTSMSGQTIEILNTDAEGRLILCDALTYCERYKPQAVVDLATLTGAIIVALGHQNSGLFCNHAPLRESLQEAADDIADSVWHMPMDERYDQALKSPYADMVNVAGAAGASITAACFLARFTAKYPWAHIDIAGTAIEEGKNRSATGRSVSLLTQWLINQVKK